MWKIGSKLIHPFNPELGVGVVRKLDGRFLEVYFPDEGRELTLSPQSSGITRLILAAGSSALLLDEDEEVVIAEALGHSYRLEDGREVEDAALWPLLPPDTPLERLATGRLNSVESFRNRVEGLQFSKLREAGGLGSFLGGRIDLFAHQLYTAQQAVAHDPVRWLLADEVGLGKTVEACLILSALLRTGRAERALLVVPDTLAVQWLSELYRKFHQVFVLLDEKRLESVQIDFGEDANPFEIHPFSVISQEQLLANPKLCLSAMMAELDLVVVDEAHRLSNEPIDDVVRPLVSMSTHALLLTATPLQADSEGFFELLSMLHPEDFYSYEEFKISLEQGGTQVPCTSSVRRADVGGLPPRVTLPVDLPAAAEELRNDPRAQWLMDQARIWAKAREKVLVFVRDVETLLALQELLEARVHLRMPVFHEGLDPATRDIEVANFRDSRAPILLCSEAGGEGRNFQFCERMVHYDLPLDPVILEQRIGRLDRIGRKIPVEIVYFRLEGEKLDVAGLYERLDLFSRPAAGLDRALVPVRSTLAGAKRGVFELDIDKLCAEVEEERQRGGKSIVEVFYPDAYHHSMESEVLEQVPEELDSLTQKVCIDAAEELGFTVVDKGGDARFYIEFGSEAIIEALPGVQDGARFLGTFARTEAVRREEMEFFSSGHPLVEGLLLELEDGDRGRAACLEIPCASVDGGGLLVFWKKGAEWEAEVVDVAGKPHPEWVVPLLEALPRARKADLGVEKPSPEWSEGLRSLGETLLGEGDMMAAALFRTTS